MITVTIWHNENCSKSRNTLTLLKEQNIDIKVVNYLDNPPDYNEIANVLKMLGKTAREIMRTKEEIYLELELDKVNSQDKLIEAMINNPQLIERPIVIRDLKAAIGRPIDNIIELIK